MRRVAARRERGAKTAGGVVAAVAAAALLLSLVVGCGEQSHAGRPEEVARASSAAPPPDVLPVALPTDRRRLASHIDRAQEIIDNPSSTSRELASAGLFEELATGALSGETPQARRATLAVLRRPAAASMRANLEAAGALSALAAPHKRLPRWRIVQPPAPNTLLGYYRAAQSRFGVGWEYLAAIELIETRFGRVQGLSSAGAQGPMQFLPATWARYGRGNIDNQRDAIFGAARYLVANGAPGDMANALYHYNNSLEYVTAVQDYAARMRADPRAYDGYYSWLVIYTFEGGTVLLPVGYPHVRPVRIHYPR
jgi:hypothetical protein